MLRVPPEEAVYRDIEKFYRVLGYYQGQELKPLEIHQKFIDDSLENELRQSKDYIRQLNYHFHMTEVLFEGHSVYKTEKPEASLVYTLFSEGILALIALRELTAQDIRDWCTVVQQTMVEFDQGNLMDLASKLWRSPSRNLRTRVYTSLMDLEMGISERKRKEKEKKAQASEATPTKHEWHERDQDWVVPDGETVKRDESASKAVDPRVVKSFKSQMLSGSTMSSSLPPDLQVEPEELSKLSEELSSYDPNHVEFNLLIFALSRLKNPSSSDVHVRTYATELLEQLASQIVTRFQPGLLIFLLAELKELGQQTVGDVQKRIEEKITQTLRDPANEKRLLASLSDDERAEVSKKLLPFLEAKQFPTIVDFYLKKDDKDGLVNFLKTVLSRDLDHESHFLSWGEQRLSSVLPLFRRLDWPKKYEFLKRALKSPSASVVKAASHYLASIQIDSQQALQIYSKLSDELKEIWLRVLTENPRKEHWSRFVAGMFQSLSWKLAGSAIVRDRLMLGWAELAFKYFGSKAMGFMLDWVTKRQWIFWPQYPQEREAILTALLNARDLRSDPSLKDLIQAEARVRFQSPELKTRLMAASKTGGTR